ncbi:DMT family transporter [Bradyrhizobium sp. SBR1B]|uniref:DMT family transporter n=1 Tax=Bradyrhizobium sp. SBR1B TaxID=2663836 RepID=UPI001FF06873|nr:DMT family transporter [Bradyrhizobium sp. SBR1B]
MARHGAGARRRAAHHLRRPSADTDRTSDCGRRRPRRDRDARLVRLHAAAIARRAEGVAAGTHQPVLGRRRPVLAAARGHGDVGDAGTGLQHQGAVGAYVFAGIVPGLLAYAGFAWLGGKFGSVRTSLVLYLGPIASALLSFAILGEPPQLIHLFGGLLILSGVWASLRR